MGTNTMALIQTCQIQAIMTVPQSAILPHVGTLNSAYWAFPTFHFQSAFIWAIALVVLWSVHKGVPKQTCKYYLRRKQGCKLMDQIQTVVLQFFCASFGRSFCRGNEHHGIDPNMLSSGHHESWLFHKGCVSLYSCQPAILPHVGTLNSAYWAFSTFQSAFIWAIAWVVLWGSFVWK